MLAREWGNFQFEMKRLFPNRPIEDIPIEHAIFNAVFPLKEKPQVPGYPWLKYYLSRGTTLLPELGPAPTDVVLSRSHGIGPMGGTDLDATLRNLGVSTIVAVGVSVNVAITNLVMDAVNLAYRVVVPRDAVAGIPTDYATSIIDNTLSLLATITTTDDLIEAWKRS